jgi:hypothetical protein
MTYQAKVKLLGRGAIPEWAPGRAVNPTSPQGTYIGVSLAVQRWCKEIEDLWYPWITVANRWTERVR